MNEFSQVHFYTVCKLKFKCICFVRKGTFLVTQTICKKLVESSLSGSIVNVGSIVSQRGNMGQCNYSASKAAVDVFSKTVALEMAKYDFDGY